MQHGEVRAQYLQKIKTAGFRQPCRVLRRYLLFLFCCFGIWPEESRRSLFFVAVKPVQGRDSAEESISLVVDAGSEEQGVCRAGATVVSKRERP